MSKFIKQLKKRLKTCLLLAAGMMLSVSVFAQQITVTGTVVDSQGETLPGVNVMVKGTSQGTITDVDGKFKISVSDENSVLQISFVGFNTQEFVVGDQRIIDVTMLESATSLDEVVVTGYGGSQIRRNLTGSVGSVSGVALERIPVASVAEALAGKVAGVMVSAVDGEPGSEINIRIRGGSSITQSNKPLFIVDGFPAANIDDIPATDVMSIDILKDASLTAIYGARGGNGVVVVTTKRAQAGKMSVNFNHTTQWRTLAKRLDVMDPYNFVVLQHEYALNKGNTETGIAREQWGHPFDMELYKRVEGSDWQDEILGKNAMSYMYNLSISGGLQNMRFNTSITHNDENGVLQGSGVMRTSVNTKLNIDVTPNLKILLNPRINFRRNKGTGANEVGDGGIVDVLRYRPTDGLRDFWYADPNVLDERKEKSFMENNPKERTKNNYKLENINTFVNQASIEWTPFKGFTFRSDGMIGIRFIDLNRFWGELGKDYEKHNYLPRAEITTKKYNEYTWQNVAMYSFSLDNNNFSFLAGQEIRHEQQREWNQSARYFPTGIEAERALQNMSLGEQWKKPSTFISSPDRSASFFGQISYNYDSKYLLQGTFRADASTKFAPENRWGYFPAISGGWVISQEDFMKNQNLISFLKIRAGIGMTGNNRIDDDMWRYQYTISDDGIGPGWGTKGDVGYQYYVNSGGKVFVNPNIKWETAINRSVALDISLFNDRLSITPEVYMNTIRDLLYKSNITTTTGYEQQMQNVAQVTSRGWELTINGAILQERNYYLRGNFNVGFNRRVIDKLNGRETEIWETHKDWKSDYANDYCLKVGQDIGLIYGFVLDGIYTIDEFVMNNNNITWNDRIDPNLVNCDPLFGNVPGRPKFKNFTNFMGGEDDYNIVNEHDRVVIGNTNPKAIGGFGFNAGWKNGRWLDFDFSCNFIYMLKFDVNNATRYNMSSMIGQGETTPMNASAEFSRDKRWRYLLDDRDRLESEYAYNENVQYGDKILGNAYTSQEYEVVNAGRTLWNPADITKRVTFDYFIEDGSFLRLQDVTIGYTLPKDIMQKVFVDRLRVYFSGYNLFLLTNYKGYDPEVDIQSGLTPGCDYNRYPRSRNFVLGVNLSF